MMMLFLMSLLLLGWWWCGGGGGCPRVQIPERAQQEIDAAQELGEEVTYMGPNPAWCVCVPCACRVPSKVGMGRGEMKQVRAQLAAGRLLP